VSWNHLEELIVDYTSAVEDWMNVFKSEVGDIYPLTARSEKLLPPSGTLAGCYQYSFHGIGCFVKSPTYEVDFDFGPNERHDVFDLWRLDLFTEAQSKKFSQYLDPNVLEQDFKSAIENGQIVRIRSDPDQYCLRQNFD
jgi:hypothetical protein